MPRYLAQEASPIERRPGAMADVLLRRLVGRPAQAGNDQGEFGLECLSPPRGLSSWRIADHVRSQYDPMDTGASRIEASRQRDGPRPLPRSIIDEPGSELQGRTGPGDAPGMQLLRTGLAGQIGTRAQCRQPDLPRSFS